MKRTFITLGALILSLSIVGCGGSSSSGFGTGIATEKIDAQVSEPIDSFVKSMINQTVDANQHLLDLKNQPPTTMSGFRAVIASEHTIVDRFSAICQSAESNQASASGEAVTVWGAGVEWCSAVRDMWDKSVELNQTMLDGGDVVDPNSPENQALFQATVDSKNRFLDTYCSNNGEFC